ncbi:hypothetical protein VXO68_15570, partial [Acinetobacter oleivorans]|uniref:hypothetical protein n=1 Tax=Acinetobacter oleivorans TaxID=1148157 RepID=UPI003A8ADD16
KFLSASPPMDVHYRPLNSFDNPFFNLILPHVRFLAFLAFYLYYLINFTLIIGYQFCIKTYLHPTAH